MSENTENKPVEEKVEATPVVNAEAKSETAGSGLDPKTAVLLAWIFTPISSVIFMLMEDMKKDEFVQFHAKQSLFFFVATLVIWAIFGVLSVVTMGIGSCLAPLVWIAIFGVQVYGAYKAYQGEKFKLPIIGDMVEK